MKTLYLVLETRGVVTGKNDWTKLGQLIDKLHLTINDFKLTKYKGYPAYIYDINNIKEPTWIKSFKIVIPVPGKTKMYLLLHGAVAAVERDDIKYKNKVADPVVVLYDYDQFLEHGLEFNVFQHELQHVYDLVMSNNKAWTNSYHVVPLWWTDEEYDLFDLIKKQIYNLDSIYDLFLKYSDYCHNTELAAYGREFSIWLNKFAVTHKTVTINDLLTKKSVDISGLAPLVINIGFKDLRNNINKVSNDILEVLADSLDNKYLSRLLGEKVRITGHNPKDKVIKVLDYIISNGLKPLYKRYGRIMNDVMMTHPNFKVNKTLFFYENSISNIK